MCVVFFCFFWVIYFVAVAGFAGFFKGFTEAPNPKQP